MKKIFTIIALVLTTSSFTQAPEKMSYQSVVRDASNALVQNQTVGMQISILQGSVSGLPVYAETQTPTTNTNGLVSLEIGTGTIVSGTFSAIDWTNGPYFIKTETDPIGGTTYTISGTSQLMSVPYALYAKTSGSSTPGPQGIPGNDGADGTNGAQGPQGIPGNDGADGAIGSQGPQGVPGNDGNDGTNGAQGPQGIPGNDGNDGANGAQGPQGIPGNDGNDGATGPAGPQGPAGANLSVNTISTSSTLNTDNQFVLAIGTITLTLPAAPATGQMIYIYSDGATNVSVNPNGKVFRQGSTDYGTSKVSDFGSSSQITLIYNGSKWYPLSIK